MIFESYNKDDEEGDFSLEDFDLIVLKYGLKPDYFLSKELDKIIITEIWSHKKSDIVANRIYEFDSYFADLIPLEIRENVMREALDIYVSEENYEEAAVLRDLINLLY